MITVVVTIITINQNIFRIIIITKNIIMKTVTIMSVTIGLMIILTVMLVITI